MFLNSKFLNFFGLWLKACFMMPLRLLLALPAEGYLCVFKRLFLFTFILIFFIILNILHLAGFALDEIFFYKYKKVAIKTPLFITGIPRSGTTYLQRVLAKDPQFTTFRTWEVLLAPSITERYFYRFLGKVISPLGYFAKKIRSLMFKKMDKVHLIGLLEAEEDFFLFLWIDCCFLMSFLCPNSEHYWSMGNFSHAVPEKLQKKIMIYYTQCLKKHLYFHGEDLIILSKNPSFTSLTQELNNSFADANFIFCIREPLQVVPSQLSSLKPAMELIGTGKLNNNTQEKLITILHRYYSIIHSLPHDLSCSIQPMNDIQSDICSSVENIYTSFELSLNNNFALELKTLQASSRRYKTAHQYSLHEFGLSEEKLTTTFSDVWPINDCVPEKVTP